MQEIAAKRRRFGYRRIGVLLERKGRWPAAGFVDTKRPNGMNCLPTKRCYRGRYRWREEHLMDIKVLGIDLGKTVCSLAGLDEAGAVVFRKRLQRHRLLDFLATLPPCVVAMEACGGAHHIGRFCLQKGHEPRLMSPLYVRPYVK